MTDQRAIPATQDNTMAAPRLADHLVPKPWVSTALASLFFLFPGTLATMAAALGNDWKLAAGCGAWASVGAGIIWFVWSQRRKHSLAAYCQAMDACPIPLLLSALEEQDLDLDEAIDLMTYLREQRPGWSRHLVETTPTPPVDRVD